MKEVSSHKFAALKSKSGRLLTGFFCWMVALTVLARMADGVTVAKVAAAEPEQQTIETTLSGKGTVSLENGTALSLPVGIFTDKLLVSEGQAVKAGDPLFSVSENALSDGIFEAEYELAKIQNQLTFPESNDPTVEAQNRLDTAKEDLAHIKESNARSEERAREDLADAEAAYQKAAENYSKADKERIMDSAVEALRVKMERLEQEKKAAQESYNKVAKRLETVSGSGVDRGEADRAQEAVTEGEAAYEKAKADLATAQAAYDQAVASGAQDQIEAAQTALAQAEIAQETAKDNRDRAKQNYYSLMDGPANASSAVKSQLNREKEKLDKATEAFEEMKKEHDELAAKQKEKQSAADAAQSQRESAEKALEQQKRAFEDGAVQNEKSLLTAERSIAEAELGIQKNLNTAKKTEAERATELLQLKNKQEKLMEKLSLLKGMTNGQFCATEDGVVLKLGFQEGEAITERGIVFASGKQEYLFHADITEKEAKDLELGSKMEIDFGDYHVVQGTVLTKQIEENETVRITVSLPEGAYKSGASGKYKLVKKSGSFPTCLPRNAVFSDNNGDFVYLIEEKKSVLGIETQLMRIPVTILADDGKMAAVEGAIPPQGKVLSSSNKAVRSGDRVRVTA